MAEVERVKKADAAAKLFGSLHKQTNDIMHQEILLPINSIDRGEFDNYVFRDRKWERNRQE